MQQAKMCGPCMCCGKGFISTRRHAIFCSNACRQHAFRKRRHRETQPATLREAIANARGELDLATQAAAKMPVGKLPNKRKPPPGKKAVRKAPKPGKVQRKLATRLSAEAQKLGLLKPRRKRDRQAHAK